MSEIVLNLGLGLRWVGFATLPVLLLPLLVLALPDRFAQFADRVSHLLDKISATTLTLSIWFAIFMVIVQILVIIGRYMFDWSATWATDLITYSFAALFLIASGSALKHDAHVRVDILREKMTAQQRAYIDLAGLYLFLFPICLLIIWASITPSFVRSWADFEGAQEPDGLPFTYGYITLVPIFAVLLMAQGVSQALKAARSARSSPPQPEEMRDGH